MLGDLIVRVSVCEDGKKGGGGGGGGVVHAVLLLVWTRCRMARPNVFFVCAVLDRTLLPECLCLLLSRGDTRSSSHQ